MLENAEFTRGGGSRWLLRLAGLGVFLLGAWLYLSDTTAQLRHSLPLAPLSVPLELTTLESLPVARGALAGHNVLLVTLDTTRADRIGIYGNDEARTPHLDRLGREGVVFSRAVAVAPTTLPTHASILTGLYPNRHGAQANSVFGLGEEQRTLAELLATEGYATAAFPSAFVLDARFGLAQGFGVYDATTTGSASSFHFAERSATDTTDRALRWLRSSSRRPFFLWVHYYDPHSVYVPPEAFADAPTPYDGEIAYVDHELGRLLAALASAGGPPTLVVVVADHGESLGDHGEYSHGYLVQQSTQQIPLLMHAPDALAGGLHVDTRVSQVDVLPTILALLGIDAPADLDGVDLTRPPDPERVVIAEAIEGRLQFGWSRLSAAYQGPWKLIVGDYARLYDLSEDPLEQRDLALERREAVARLRRLLERARGEDGRFLRPSSEGLSPGDAERLAALGYVLADAEPVDAAGPGPDPRDWTELVSKLYLLAMTSEQIDRIGLVTRAVAWLAGSPVPADGPAAIRAIEEMVAEHPDFAPGYLYIAELHAREGQAREAARARDRLKALRAESTGERR